MTPAARSRIGRLRSLLRRRRPLTGLLALALPLATTAVTAVTATPATSATPEITAGAAPAGHAYVHHTVPLPPGTTPATDWLLPKIEDLRAAGIDSAALTHLILRARILKSDALVVLKDGKLLADVRFVQPVEPIECGSITKSVAALAIGRLLETGRIRSLDAPVSTWYPEWGAGAKRAITLRMLMDHTSGIEAVADTAEIEAAPDMVRQALDAPLAEPPGSHFFYNNKAVNLLAGIVEKASGRKLDEVLRDEIFAPLGISRFDWMRDPAGNPQVFAGLAIDARDLARLGQLMLDGGTHAGRRLLGAGFVHEATSAAQPFTPTSGLLWWVIPQWARMTIDETLLAGWRAHGVDPKLVDAVAPLAGREVPRDELFAALDRAYGRGAATAAWVHNITERGLPTPHVTYGPAAGFDANGSLGQYLVVLPASRVVAVRQIRRSSFLPGDDFEDFPDLVRALAPAPRAAATAPRSR